MRIADYTRVWTAHGLGGMQVRASIVAKGLAQRGHQVHVFTTSLNGSNLCDSEDEGVLVHYIPGTIPGQYKREYFDGALELFQQIGGFDVVHSNSSAARRHIGGPIPVVATWHGIGSPQDDLNLLKIGGSPKGARFDESIRNYDRSIVVGPHEKRLLLEHGIPAERVHVVLPGLDQRVFTPDASARARVRERLGFRPDEFVAGLAGRLVFDKGVDQMLTALPHLDPRIRLLAVGDGGAIHTSRAANQRIVHVPVCPHTEMPGYYNAMDLLVNPTSRHQGFDMTIAEATLCGVPVLTSNTNPANEVLTGQAASFELGDALQLAQAIETIYRSGSAGDLGRKARALAEVIFTRDRMLREVESVLATASGNSLV